MSFKKEGFVAIWAGKFDSEDKYDSYIEENYEDLEDEDLEDDSPLSDFADDFNLGHYDSDFQDAAFNGEEYISILDFIKGASYSSSFIKDVEIISKTKTFDKVNAIVLIYDLSFKPDKIDEYLGFPLKFIGNFKYNKKSLSVLEEEEIV